MEQNNRLPDCTYKLFRDCSYKNTVIEQNNRLSVYYFALLQYSYRYNSGNNIMKQCNILAHV